MRTTFILVLLFLLNGFSIAKNNVEIKSVSSNSFTAEIRIPATSFTDVKKGKFTVRNYFEFEDYSKACSYKLPSYHFVFVIPPYSKPKITIKSKKEKTLTNVIPSIQPSIIKENDSTLAVKEMTRTTDKNYITPADFEIEHFFWYRDYYCVSVKINSHKFFPTLNSIKEISEITLEFSFDKNLNLSNSKHSNSFDKVLNELFANYELASSFRSSMPKDLIPDTTGGWINYDADYIKLSVVEDGIYRFTGNDIISLGFDISSINPTSLKLFESGNEVPLYVYDGNDGTFDADDYIEFYGRKNPPFGNYKTINNDYEDYNEYENRYCDTSFYFLTWDNSPGNRIFEQTGFNNTLTDTVNYYNEKLHFEKNNWVQNINGNETMNQLADWHKNKTWYWGWIGYWSPNKVFHFNAPDFVPEKNAKAFFKASLAGLSSQMSFMLNINNTRVDSQRINKYHQMLLEGEFNTSILQENNNDLNLQCVADDGNYAAMDWYEVDYPKFSSLINDSLTLEIYSDVIPGEKIIKIGNADTTNYFIYKIFPVKKKIVSYQVENGYLFFSDTVNVGDKYFIVASSNIKYPQNAVRKHFINLRNSENQADYIAITHSVFGEEVDNYLNYISSNYSVNVKKVYVNDIFDEFSFGYPYPDAIRLFLYKAFTEWNEPKVSYVNLIGDASYDYKYIKYRNEGVKVSIDYVPSYGYPVGDYWYVVWDENAPPIPQLKLSRLPITQGEELSYYLQKIEEENEHPFDVWNKTALFFSGGDANNPNELQMFKNTNDQIISSYIEPIPYAANYHHFYKTYDPPTDFGPFTQEEVNTAISEGSVIIGYLGHSGTATWDNGINSVLQLQNSKNRHPLVTDFGCSTNKFAEPDMVCFGERFLLDENGQALGYMGNSSLGFQRTAINISKLFYEKMIADSLYTISDAHLSTKIEMFNRYGTSNVYKVFAYSNVFLGEPLIQAKIPPKTNFHIDENSLITDVSSVGETIDSLLLKFSIFNYGLSSQDSVNVKIRENYLGNMLYEKIIKIPVPRFVDTLTTVLHTKNKPGVHAVEIIVDYDNRFEEIDKNDNEFVYNINVFSTELRDFTGYVLENGAINNLKILNPVLQNSEPNNILLYLDDNPDFSFPRIVEIPLGKFYSVHSFSNIPQNKRLWFKYKLNTDEAEFSLTKSFFNSNNSSKFLLNDNLSFSKQTMEKIRYKEQESELSLINDSLTISVLSAGAYSGATCVIAVNGENLLTNTFMAGMGVAVFDSTTLEVDTAFSILLFQRPDNVQALADFINQLEQGKLVAMGVMNDARNNMSNELRNAIKTLGSTKIDSLQFQAPWALIGYKGAPPGSVIEEVKGPYDGQIYIDTTFVLPNKFGRLTTINIGPASAWGSVAVEDSVPVGANINYRVLGENPDNSYDTLSYLNFENGVADISFLNDSAYSHIKILAEFNASENYISPILKSLAVDYTGFAELGTNYQTVALEKDSVNQGEDLKLNFSVYNAGEIKADSFNVSVNLIKPDNSTIQLDSFFVPSLQADTNISFSTTFNTADYKGDGRFAITIDTENKVQEYYEDNNYYTIPFFVIEDTTRPELDVTIDGEDIPNGIYISAKPVIKISLSDYSPLAITDTSSVIIKLNDKQIYYNNPDRTDEISDENPKYTVTYTPTLETGEYTLYVNGKDANGNFAEENGIEKHFKVSTKAELLEVYNYPNPFENDTYFTFKLTQIPDEFKIRIFTVAGRLIREIKLDQSELNYDFNRIYWDGRDQDGDEIANGVYFYKIILKKGNETVTKIQKLAKVR